MPPLMLRAWVWVCMATVRLAACGGSWKEERKEREGSAGLQQPRRAAIFRNPVFISWLHQACSCGSSRVWLALRALLELKWHPVKVYAPKQRGVTFGTKCRQVKCTVCCTASCARVSAPGGHPVQFPVPTRATYKFMAGAAGC